MMTVVAYDPGVTTGWATGYLETKESPLKVSCGQEQFDYKFLWLHLGAVSPTHIVCESFEYRNAARTGLVTVSLEYIGVIKLFAALRHSELTMQTAMQGKGYYKDSNLKKLDLHRPGHPHAMDALRHLLHWYTFGPGYQFNNNKGFVY